MTVSVQQKKGPWYVVVSYKKENGKWATKWHKTGLVAKGNKKRAELMADEIMKQYKDDITIESKWKVDEYILYWFNHVIKNTVEVTTWEGYGTVVETHLAPYFKAKNIGLRELKTSDIQLYINRKYESGRIDGKGGLSANFLKKHYAILKKALDHAVKSGIIAVNPILNVELPKVNPYIASYYTVEQLEKLLEITKGTSIESVVFLTAHYGFRRGEVLGLRYSDIDFAEKTLTVRNTRTKVKSAVEKQPKSIASYRTLPLMPRVEKYLVDLKKKQEQDKILFGSEYQCNNYICKTADGAPININSLSHIFKRILEQNDMPHIRFHDIRHSVASYLLKNGVSLKEIQLWCGHSDISVTAMFYTHVDLEMKRNAGEKINALFGD